MKMKMKVPFFSKSKRPEGEVHLASQSSSESKASSPESKASSASITSSGSSSSSLSPSPPLSLREKMSSGERKKVAKLKKSSSFSSSLKERTGKLWSFGAQRQESEPEAPASGLPNRELSETFRYFDKNGDGKISASELGQVLRALGIESTDEELETMVREVDCDCDGFIDVDEFVQLNKLATEATEGEDGETKFMEEAFDVFDIDGDGYISAGELYRVLSGLGEAGLTVEQCSAMIRNVDKDGNGLVDFNEFKCLMQESWVC